MADALEKGYLHKCLFGFARDPDAQHLLEQVGCDASEMWPRRWDREGVLRLRAPPPPSPLSLQYVFTFTYDPDGQVHMSLAGKGKRFASRNGRAGVESVKKQYVVDPIALRQQTCMDSAPARHGTPATQL